MCPTGLKLLAQSDSCLGRLRWRWHAMWCQACAELHASERFVDEFIARAGRWQDPHEVTAVTPGMDTPEASKQKEKATMRRFALAALGVLVFAALATILVPRASAPDADSILAAAAHAMESADTVHLVGAPTPPLEDIPVIRFMLTPPGTGGFDLWVTDDCIYSLTYGSDGWVIKGYAADVAANAWWFFSAKENRRYVADLSGLMPQAGDIVAKAAAFTRTGLVSDVFTEALGVTLSDVEKSVAVENRRGREVAVVTTTYTITDAPQRVSGRLVVEVDRETDRALAIRQYIRAGDRPEKLLADIGEIEYGVPIPFSEIGAAIPADARVVEVTGTIEEIGPWLSLRMVHGDEVIVETDVPRD